MRSVALEMSTRQGSIAWHEGDALLFDCQFAADRQHSGEFFENLELCVKRFGQPTQVLVGLGPGSYAGVRITLAAALGLSSASKAVITGIPSICALDVEERDYCVIGDARRQSYFFARVRDGRVVEGPVLESATELDTRMHKLSTPVYRSEDLARFATAKLAYPAARRMFEIAHLHGGRVDGPLEPIYLREPHITVAKAAPGLAAQR